ncbi:MAG TPA: hypothetical protein VGM18_01420 [Candidatus Sulfotelmatobacter sp.]
MQSKNQQPVRSYCFLPASWKMSDHQIRAMIEKEARALGLTFDDAVSRVQKGQIGENYLWQDLASLVYLLHE